MLMDGALIIQQTIEHFETFDLEELYTTLL